MFLLLLLLLVSGMRAFQSAMGGSYAAIQQRKGNSGMMNCMVDGVTGHCNDLSISEPNDIFYDLYRYTNKRTCYFDKDEACDNIEGLCHIDGRPCMAKRNYMNNMYRGRTRDSTRDNQDADYTKRGDQCTKNKEMLKLGFRHPHGVVSTRLGNKKRRNTSSMLPLTSKKQQKIRKACENAKSAAPAADAHEFSSPPSQGQHLRFSKDLWEDLHARDPDYSTSGTKIFAENFREKVGVQSDMPGNLLEMLNLQPVKMDKLDEAVSSHFIRVLEGFANLVKGLSLPHVSITPGTIENEDV